MYREYLILLITLMSSSMGYGFSDLSGDTCKFHFRSEEVGDEEIRSIFDQVSSAEAVKICTGNNKRKAYFVASEIVEKDGIYYFYLTRAFAEFVESNKYWSSIPPKELQHIVTKGVYMCEKLKNSIRHDEIRFVQTRNISIGVFRKVSNSWNSIFSSKKLFDKASEGLSFLEKFSSDLESLEKVLFKNSSTSGVRLFSIEFIHGDDSSFPRYKSSLTDGSQFWSVEFDFHSGSIQLYKVALISE